MGTILVTVVVVVVVVVVVIVLLLYLPGRLEIKIYSLGPPDKLSGFICYCWRHYK
jgi:hypothetical protein